MSHSPKVALFLSILFSTPAFCATELKALFTNSKPILAVINLKALPGQKNFTSMPEAIQDAVDQLKILEDEGVDGALIENVQGGFSATPEVIASMTEITSAVVRASHNVIVGIEVLWHDPKASLAIAKASGARFIRTDFWVDKMKAGDKIVDENPGEILAYRTLIGAENVAILTDIQVKYAEMIDPSKTIEESARQAAAAKSGGVVVSGRKSGEPPSLAKVLEAKKGAVELEVVIGSGLNLENASTLLGRGAADAAIVGTSISTGTGGSLVREKVRQLMNRVKQIRAEL